MGERGNVLATSRRWCGWGVVRRDKGALFGDGEGSGWGNFREPSLEPVEGEWVGHRSRLGDVGTRESEITEPEKYGELVKDATSDVTMLYVHGGGFSLQS